MWKHYQGKRSSVCGVCSTERLQESDCKKATARKRLQESDCKKATARKRLLGELCQTRARTERQNYRRLLSIVIEDLTSSAVDAAVRADYPAPASMLNNVCIGRVLNLEHLVALVRYGLVSWSSFGHAEYSYSR